MQRAARIAAGMLVALMVAWLAGWLMGRSGKPELQASLDRTQLRLMLSEARGGLLEARVDLYNVNFGNASRRLEEAKPLLRSAAEHLRIAGIDGASTQLAAALKHVDEAQALANKLDQTANTHAGEAVTAIEAATAALD